MEQPEIAGGGGMTDKSVLIYTTRWCPFCVRAKSLLNAKGISYREIAVDGDREARATMTAKAGRSSVPQIWIDDFHVGGCDELHALERQGKLDSLLAH